MDEEVKKYQIHKVLAHSYSFYFLSFLLGIILDFYEPTHLPKIPWAVYFGFLFLISGPLIIYWAQHTSRNLKKGETMSADTFFKGPYKYTRGPTHLGIALMLVGFGMTVNAFFVVVLSLLAAIITRFTFLRKEEEILEKKYGDPYMEYKKKVKL
jgi:protein-S-isoprenylcysteine O-methyltransferase Ste14